MEPRKDEQPKSPGQHKEPPKKRFRLIKLEERIAPANGPPPTHHLPCSFCCHGHGSF
jgi:hypothetical protein